MLSQGIAGPRFEKPEEVVEWMGAMQAQDIRAAYEKSNQPVSCVWRRTESNPFKMRGMRNGD